jgi:hypothetical protein
MSRLFLSRNIEGENGRTAGAHLSAPPPSPTATSPAVATIMHRCLLSRKDWDLAPGMGLYCDRCERLCRSP